MMKKTMIISLIAFAVYFVIPTNISAQAKYVGSKVCGMCHKSEKQGQQLKIWTDSKHAQAYKTLLTPKADELAKKGGKKASETPECLKCHVGEKTLVESAFKEDGVQCETCHGAGSDYKAMAVMKNKEEAVKKGLNVPKDVEKFCKTCHNPESPSYKDFKFNDMWKKIVHVTPKG